MSILCCFRFPFCMLWFKVACILLLKDERLKHKLRKEFFNDCKSKSTSSINYIINYYLFLLIKALTVCIRLKLFSHLHLLSSNSRSLCFIAMIKSAGLKFLKLSLFGLYPAIECLLSL